MSFHNRDAIEVEALHTDRYLEALLAQRDRGDPGTGDADDAPLAPADVTVDQAIATVAARLGRDLVRVHPSFRFEERLARRLAGVAAAMHLPAAAGAEGSVVPVIPFPFGPHDDPAADELVPGGTALPRPVLIGGAVASAAISLAGAAFVAWRLGRPGADPMARAARAAHQLREATRPVRVRLD